jgi:ubiquinone/menaquinone biosynthesis C-methylase UbiE
VIDLGGSPVTWADLTFPERITIVNLKERPQDTALDGRSHYVRADALLTPFPDQVFDLAFANSVIEHVGDPKQQETFASEMLRVGRHVYCQTPNRWFPVEPHYLALLVHWLPRACFTYFVHRYMTVGGLITKPSREKHERVKAGIRLLSRRELQRLFPGCKIKTERFLGIPKSYAAYR